MGAPAVRHGCSDQCGRRMFAPSWRKFLGSSALPEQVAMKTVACVGPGSSGSGVFCLVRSLEEDSEESFSSGR